MKFYEPGTKLLSEPFTSPKTPHISWQLEIYPNGVDPARREHMEVFILYSNSQSGTNGNGIAGGWEERGVRAHFHVYLPQPLFCFTQKHTISENTCRFFSHASRIGCSRYAHSKVEPLLRGDGSLLVRADVRYAATVNMTPLHYSNGTLAQVDEAAMMENCREAFVKMLVGGEGADCSIMVGP